MSIGIIGTGIAGLHLALRLRQLGVEATLYSPRTPDAIRGGRLPNVVTRMASTRERERVLGVDHWQGESFDNAWMHLHVEAPDGPSFSARLPRPAASLDFRLYLAALLEDYLQRGGRVVHRSVDDQRQLAALAGQHDLVVVAAGREALVDAFPRDPARSPFTGPRRWLLGGLFRGVRPPEPAGMSMHMVPGAGEVHAPTYHSFDGSVTAILVEALPDGPFFPVATADHGDDPQRLTAAVLDLVTAHVPALAARVDRDRFALTRPLDALQGALTPVVRRGWAPLGDGRAALAIGDAWIVHDPITAQGANLGSQQAFELADALCAHAGPYDEEFCRAMSERLWVSAQPVVDWTNTFVGEPAPQLGALIGAAAGDQRVADAFVANLDRPAAMWRSIRDQESTDEFIATARSRRSAAWA